MAKKEATQGAAAAERKELPAASRKGDDEQEVPEEETPIDFDAILAEFDPANVEKREAEERRKEAEAKRKEAELHREEREILEKIYNVKPKSEEGDDGGLPGETRPIEDEEAWENIGRDKEGWTEGDLDEEWIEPPENATNMFYDPHLGITGIDSETNEDDGDRQRASRFRRRRGKKRPKKKIPLGIRTPDVYVPFRRPLPPIPDDDDEIIGAEGVLRELEMEEEFLDWDSYVFQDGSTYEGTTWNDLAQGKGVYTTPLELCTYEGEWVQNAMQGHGVLTVDVPRRVPAPNSKLAAKEGQADEDQFLSSEDREWLKMELEDLDAAAMARQQATSADNLPSQLKRPPYDQAVPYEENPLWKKIFGRLPPKGHYKYAGEMKHSRMHGCGVYELNGRMIWGKWYFGEFLADPGECDAETSGFHAAMAEVAAAKARMFTNKPDGMVREVRGPYTDPSHPYMYEDEDMWMAPGFINEFHPVPTAWKKYAEEVDAERESWLNSFTQAPLRIPMPPELEQIWDKDEEFVVLGNTPNLEGRYTKEDKIMAQKGMQGKVLLHVPSKQLINWAEDKDGQLRFFIQPYEPGQEIDPTKIKPLPLGFKEFMEDKVLDEEEVEGEPTTVEQKLQEVERKRKKRQQRWAREDELRKANLAAKLEAQRRELEEAKQQEEAEMMLRREEIARELELQDETFSARLEEITAKQESILSGVDEAEKASEEDSDEEEETEDEEGEEQAAAPVKANEEEEEEEEEERKPRSFGKVAMLDEDTMKDAMQRRCGTEADKGKGGSLPPFPTVFASVSMASQIGFLRVMQTTASALSGLRLPWQASPQVSPQVRTLLPQSLSAVPTSPPTSVNVISVQIPRRARRSSPISIKYTAEAVPRRTTTSSAKSKAPQEKILKQSGLRRSSRLQRSQIRANSQETWSSSSFSMPYAECLSLAIPVAEE